MVLTPEEQAIIEERFEALEEQISKLKRKNNLDHRISLLTTSFDLEDAIFPPAVRVYNSANISIPHATSTVLTYNTNLFDTDTIHSTTTNPSRLTCNTAGLYLIASHARWQEWSTGARQLFIHLNGTTTIVVAEDTGDATQTEGRWQTVTTIYSLDRGDYVETFVYQAKGSGNLNVETASRYSPDFMMCRIGPPV